MKKKLLIASVGALTITSTAAIAVFCGAKRQKFVNASDETYWNHYAQVTPSLLKHGSKEFWANCATHTFSLTYPGDLEDIREGGNFDDTVYFDDLTSEDPRYLPPLSERVDIKGYLQDLVADLDQDPYSYIPDGMRPESATKVTQSQVTYDFTTFNNVSNIKYGGYGEQWHMVVENIEQSEEFYKITTLGSEIITASNVLVYAFLDDYYDGTVSKTFSSDARFTAKLEFNGSTLTYSIQFISGINIPLFGSVTPQVDMEYEIGSHTKTFRIQLGENNALKFEVTPDSYTFALEYGIETVSRKAYFTISKDENDEVEGHVYEYVQYKDKDLVPACADFYIDEDYASVVGNKASGIVGFNDYINELYLTEEGKLLGYEIMEEKTVLGVSVQFNTLWFNLPNISGINNIKYIENDGFYVNNSAVKFESKNVGGVSKKSASRRYDIENRKQYFYSETGGELVEHETSIPMMFIQTEQLGTFSSDVNDKNSYLNVSLNISNTYLTKIQDDYSKLIDIFKDNKDDITTANIVSYIGSPKNLN